VALVHWSVKSTLLISRAGLDRTVVVAIGCS
jgi:hypothetical protein